MYVYREISLETLVRSLQKLVCMFIDRKKPPLPGGFSIYYVP